MIIAQVAIKINKEAAKADLVGLADGVPVADLGLDDPIITGRSLSPLPDLDDKKDGGFAYAAVCPSGLQAKRPGAAPLAEPGARGEIRGFSPASRRRLTEKLMRLPLDEIMSDSKHAAGGRGVFLTLTYPAIFPDPKDTQRDLAAFRKRMNRRWPGIDWGLWKKEPQKRGAPHYHITLSFDVEISIRVLEDWAKEAWFEVVGSGDLRHKRHGAACGVLYGPVRKLVEYLIKYLGKTWESDEPTGRIWGVWGNLPSIEEGVIRIESKEAWVKFQRRIRRWGKKSRYLRNLRHVQGVRLFGVGWLLAGLVRGLDVTIYGVSDDGAVVQMWFCDDCGVLAAGEVCPACGSVGYTKKKEV